MLLRVSSAAAPGLIILYDAFELKLVCDGEERIVTPLRPAALEVK
jgi:hypothetical protein